MNTEYTERLYLRHTWIAECSIQGRPILRKVGLLLVGDSAGRTPAANEFVEIMVGSFVIAKKCLQRAHGEMQKARDGESALMLQTDQLALLKEANGWQIQTRGRPTSHAYTHNDYMWSSWWHSI